jgi:signal transduction histidine kinase
LVGFGVIAGLLYEGMLLTQHSPQNPLTIVIFAFIILLIAFQSSYYVGRIREKDDEVVKIKDEFLFRTVHDLRSPTTAIRFTLEKYKADAVFAATAEAQKDFTMVDAALNRISLLIEDLLKIAAGNSPSFEVKEDVIDIRSLIRGSELELDSQLRSKNLTFRYAPQDDLPPVIGDAEKLKEVFSNFFDNAVKYNREGGSLTVSHRQAKGFLLTDITDTGIGISARNQAKLFAPFFRGDIGNEIAGTGLGLFMTRKLLQKMRGSVTVASTEGKGTTFTVSLPTAATK